MLKIRCTFIDNPDGQVELQELLDEISNNYEIINQSKIYKGRNGS